MRRLALALLPVAAGCTWFESTDSVLITSDPAGARVLIDGTDMQCTTPTMLHIGGSFGYDHVLTLQKRGYRDEQRLLSQFTEGYTSQWINGAATESEPPLPIFWTAGDLFLPFGVRSAIVPHEVYVRLYPEDAPPLGFEALRLQAAARARDAGVTR